ncbi:MAG: hypothetical protein GYB64_12100 [Chloroflexi bacterium]|nr:hypothetical protein [Chloroflexota bacterium]
MTTLSDWLLSYEPIGLDNRAQTCYEEIWLRIGTDHPGDVQVLELIAWLNAYASDDPFPGSLDWDPGSTHFELTEQGSLLVETPDFYGLCNPYDILDIMSFALDEFIETHPDRYADLLDAYYGG